MFFLFFFHARIEVELLLLCVCGWNHLVLIVRCGAEKTSSKTVEQGGREREQRYTAHRSVHYFHPVLQPTRGFFFFFFLIPSRSLALCSATANCAKQCVRYTASVPNNAPSRSLSEKKSERERDLVASFPPISCA